MPAAPYVPPKDADFDPWLDNIQTLIDADPTTYGLTAPDAVIITAAYDAWHAAYLLATNPTTRTSPAVAQKTAVRRSTELTVRPYCQQICRNQGIDPNLIVGLGLNLPNNTRPPIPAPNTQPTLTLVSATFLRHNLSARDASLGPTKKQPFGSVGMQLFRSVGTVAATDPEQCQLYATWTKSPNFATFSAEQRGKVCTYFARYVTKGGPNGQAQPGPWSDPLVVTVM